MNTGPDPLTMVILSAVVLVVLLLVVAWELSSRRRVQTSEDNDLYPASSGTPMPYVEAPLNDQYVPHDNSDLIGLLGAVTRNIYYIDVTAFRCTPAYRERLEEIYDKICVMDSGEEMTDIDWTRVTTLSDD